MLPLCWLCASSSSRVSSQAGAMHHAEPLPPLSDPSLLPLSPYPLLSPSPLTLALSSRTLNSALTPLAPLARPACLHTQVYLGEGRLAEARALDGQSPLPPLCSLLPPRHSWMRAVADSNLMAWLLPTSRTLESHLRWQRRTREVPVLQGRHAHRLRHRRCQGWTERAAQLYLNLARAGHSPNTLHTFARVRP